MDVEMASILWEGDADSLGFILDANFSSPYKNPDSWRRDLAHQPLNLRGFLSRFPATIEMDNSGEGRIEIEGYISPNDKSEIEEDLLKHEVKMARKLSCVTRRGLDSHDVYDIARILLKGDGVSYTFGDIISFLSIDISHGELSSLVDFGILPIYTRGRYGDKDAAFASYLLSEATDYLYGISFKGGKILITGSTLQTFQRLEKEFGRIMADIETKDPTYAELLDYDSAVAVSWELGYKCFSLDGSFFAALPTGEEIRRSFGHLKESAREGMLRDLGERCGGRDSLTREDFSSLPLSQLATVVTVKSERGDAICLTRKTIERYRFRAFSRLDFTRHVREGTSWAYYTSLGYSPPREESSILDVKQNLQFDDRLGVYYYKSSSGLRLEISSRGRIYSQEFFNEANRIFKEGRLFDSQTFTVYRDTGGEILSNPPLYGFLSH